MRNRPKVTIAVTGTVAAIVAVWLVTPLQTPAAAQATASDEFPPYTAPRTADGRPDFNGIWQSVTTANWDLEAHSAAPGPYPELLGAWGAQPGGQSIVEGGVIPYRPEALARKKARDGSLRANGRDVTLPEGGKLFLGSQGTGAPPGDQK